ncbi:unnamed protein product [Gongylonema pulchrum]|uniref:Palmitoyltransferase n=1 Tax=Gongylonema pulchrum TaxID=637853 RepID=A0A183E7U9_9BILA|nr:unnamed protein product [Gongylonema pulchrum]
MLILFILLPLGFLFEIFAVLPSEHEFLSKGWNVRVAVLALLGLNAFAAVQKVISVGPNGGCSDLPAIQKLGYRFCNNCQLNEPPRSHHLCNKCAFRRDHHCSFVAVCIGHFNQRYYINAVCNFWIIATCAFRRDHHCSFVAVCIGHFNQRYYINAICNFWIIATVCMLWNWSFMWTALGGFSPLQIWELIVPHLALLLRVINFKQFFCVAVFVCSFTVFIFLCYLIVAQCFCLFRGQTRVEYLLVNNINKLN